MRAWYRGCASDFQSEEVGSRPTARSNDRELGLEMVMQVVKDVGTGSGGVYVYYFPSQRDGASWPCKVGRGNNPVGRIRSQQAGMQEEPVVALIFRTDFAHQVESFLHTSLANKKLATFGREWFETTPDEVENLLNMFTPVDEIIREKEDLGSAIRRQRALLGMTQADVKDKTGIHQGTLSDVERSEGNSTLQTYLRILSELGLELVCRAKTMAQPDWVTDVVLDS